MADDDCPRCHGSRIDPRENASGPPSPCTACLANPGKAPAAPTGGPS